MAKAGSPRERGYVEMAEYLYGDGPKARRDTLFTEAAERLSIANPSDDEAKMFWAIGLLGLNQSVRDFTTYMKAGALAEEVLRRNPEHPAAAHFVIHAFDDPLHAPLGLWAARAYSKIAAGAPHAVHMTSHIYVALGMWDDVIEQNIGASGHDHESYVPGHYTWWLGYGYVQAGRFDEARKHLETVKANFDKKLPRASAAALQMMRAHYVIDGERWTDPAAKWKLTSPPSALGEGTTAFFDGFVAARAGDVAAAKSAREVLSQRLQRAASASEDSKMLKVLHAELGAAIASASRNHDEAVALARSAAADEDAMPFEFGPPQFAKPTHELLGEVLLAANKPAEAKTAFQRSLARMPGRSRSLIGLARAAIAIGDKSTAETAVATLKSNWHAADKSLTELAGLTKQLAAGAR
jgi:tetratricopeptide (TPR) repeat protein